MYVVIRDRGDTHEPFVRDSADGWDAVLHGHMDVASSREFPFPPFSFRSGRSPRESLHHQFVSVGIPPPPCAKFGKHAAMLEELYTLIVRFQLLSIVRPVFVAESEICFAGKGKERDFVEYRV